MLVVRLSAFPFSFFFFSFTGSAGSTAIDSAVVSALAGAGFLPTTVKHVGLPGTWYLATSLASSSNCQTEGTENNKQLLDEVFVISGIIKVEVSVISRSRRLRLITLTEILIIPDITKTEFNNCFIIHCFSEKNKDKTTTTVLLIPTCRLAFECFSLKVFVE